MNVVSSYYLFKIKNELFKNVFYYLFIFFFQIGFNRYSQEFLNSRVDGDLLLQMNETSLTNDIGISNGILRKRYFFDENNKQ